MALTSKYILLTSILLSLTLMSSTQTCSNYTFSNKQVFRSCSDLPVLQGHLHWNYMPSTKRIQIAYRATQTSTGWIAWAINPTATAMLGSQALVAFRYPNGSMTAYPTPITSYNPSMQPGTLSFKVSKISATYANNEMIIFAEIGPLNKRTTINHVWQAGSSVLNNVPQIHPTSGANIQSMDTVDFLT
ncbi:cytochrome b and DOMON domain-containing protein [Tripterygium wilfordii]|uniref:Cytochrome b and DOMON domain-containing protein n=2 Tax=Tripterygium wilfordii TaxID=458696 RepID=A0A7J7D4Y9_TRIWF|nr:cytochrome b and DOMON domain-containing protein [Tripterygium wilfordii]